MRLVPLKHCKDLISFGQASLVTVGHGVCGEGGLLGPLTGQRAVAGSEEKAACEHEW